VEPGEVQVDWRRLILSIQHIPRPPYEQQHRILMPMLEQLLNDLEAGGLKGTASTFTMNKLTLNGTGEFTIGGPEGDNRLSGKKLVIDHYGPGVRSAAERSAARTVGRSDMHRPHFTAPLRKPET
jgi:S-adenosylmethionine synthetase